MLRILRHLSAFACLLIANDAVAEVCEYKPSKLFGETAAAIGAAAATGSTAAGVGLQTAGYYTLVHAGSGLTMLGSTAAGTSAAGTVGIIAGTSGVIGTVGSILMAPVTIVVGSLTIIGVGAFEGVCYFQIERITDPYEVRAVLENVSVQDEAVSIVKTENGDAMAIELNGHTETYLLRNLYITDGVLKHRDWGPNSNLGSILYATTDGMQ